MKSVIASLIKDALKKEKIKLTDDEIVKFIEIPPSQEMGDFAFPCFFLAKQMKMSPAEIAMNLRKNIGDVPDGFEDIELKGPYINFFLNRKTLTKIMIEEILKQRDNFGKNNSGAGKKIVIEFSSPNIAKPFGIGHLRSTIIGNSVSRISEFNGYKMIKINYLGDWGTQFGKLIFAFKKWGDLAKFKKNPVKYLYELYVKVNKKIYEEKARNEFLKLEQGDEENLALWEKFKNISIHDFEKIYSQLGIKFDLYLGESMYNQKMKEVIQMLKDKKLLQKSEGAEIVDLEQYNLGVALIQKSDGATLYATRDLASAIARYESTKFDRMFYEVGQEQILHLKQVFKILELLGYKWAKECVHIYHGLYLDADGKKFATRKGKTIFMEDILEETISLASKEIKKREPKISKKELENRASKVANAAILYGDLKNNRANNIVFDIKRFVSFEGDTGPYLLYSYARANSILAKVKSNNKKIIINDLEEKEIALSKKLSDFQQVVQDAYKTLNPSLIANYSYQLAQIFNEFYHACPVIGSKEKESFRIALVDCFRQVLKNALYLLGIETLEKM
ncbi:arginine--tRNA ligase [Candidatus Pacearchaeota archaeon]|jgi:arginyl-tRNA synthetase|nr:arginine--tRNA ligase [Candidatus Pacearchaeota archaeon]